MVQKIYLGVGPVLTQDEARSILNRAGADLAVGGSAPGDDPAATVAALVKRQLAMDDVMVSTNGHHPQP